MPVATSAPPRPVFNKPAAASNKQPPAPNKQVAPLKPVAAPRPAAPISQPPKTNSNNRPPQPPASPAKPEPKILFQRFFKSVGPRTYAAQVKEANNGNHFLVLTEGKRDDKTNEVRKTRVYVYSEDFPDFFRMIKESAEWIKANPMSPEARDKRKRFWAKQAAPKKD